MTFTHMVKNKHDGRVMYFGFLADCKEEASSLSAQHQTGDFIVVPYEMRSKR